MAITCSSDLKWCPCGASFRGQRRWKLLVPYLMNMADGVTPAILNSESVSQCDGQYEAGGLSYCRHMSEDSKLWHSLQITGLSWLWSISLYYTVLYYTNPILSYPILSYPCQGFISLKLLSVKFSLHLINVLSNRSPKYCHHIILMTTIVCSSTTGSIFSSFCLCCLHSRPSSCVRNCLRWTFVPIIYWTEHAITFHVLAP
jgi:hypothetical protein